MSQTATANDSRALSWHLAGQKAKASILTPFDFTSFSFVSNTMVERTTSLYQQAQMSSYSGTLQCTSDVLIISLTAPNNITIINYLIPLAPALAFLSDDEKEAIEIANDSKFGLGASIWTQNLEKAEELSSMVESGTVTVNNVMISETLLFHLVV